jgi:hypothetical protein
MTEFFPITLNYNFPRATHHDGSTGIHGLTSRLGMTVPKKTFI